MLEIMIVIAIIAALGAGVGVVVFNNFKKAQVKIAKQRVGEVMQGVTQFMIENNPSCPHRTRWLICINMCILPVCNSLGMRPNGRKIYANMGWILPMPQRSLKGRPSPSRTTALAIGKSAS